MAQRHQYAPEEDRVAAAEQPITDQTSQYWREVNQADVKAKSLRGERLDRKRSGDPFQKVPICLEADNLLNMPRQQQLVGHVEREQGDHAMKGNALPQLRARQCCKSTRVTKNILTRRWYVARFWLG